MNNKARLIVRRAFGFHSDQAFSSMLMHPEAAIRYRATSAVEVTSRQRAAHVPSCHMHRDSLLTAERAPRRLARRRR
jgi:hypothetical protein